MECCEKYCKSKAKVEECFSTKNTLCYNMGVSSTLQVRVVLKLISLMLKHFCEYNF